MLVSILWSWFVREEANSLTATLQLTEARRSCSLSCLRSSDPCKPKDRRRGTTRAIGRLSSNAFKSPEASTPSLRQAQIPISWISSLTGLSPNDEHHAGRGKSSADPSKVAFE